MKLFLYLSACTQNNFNIQEKTATNKIDQAILYVDFETPNSIGTFKRSKCLVTFVKTPVKLITEHINDTVVTNNEGWGEFRCPAGSVSVWVPECVKKL